MVSSKADVLFYAGVEVITFTTVEGALYGFSFALFIFCVRSLYKQLEDQDRRRHHFITLVCMAVIMICGLLQVVVDARDIQSSYVDHAGYPGGGVNYTATVFDKLPIEIVSNAASMLLDFVTFGVQIWRLWIIWRLSLYSHFIVIIPILALLGYIAIEISSAVLIEGSELSQRLNLFFLYAATSLQLSINLIVTILIIARIALVRRRHIELMGKSDVASQYTSIISMLVESYALETLWMIAILTCTAVANQGENIGLRGLAISNFFADTQSFVEILAYLLVVYRVATGRGWKEDTEQKLTSLQWNRDEPPVNHLRTQDSVPISFQGV